MLHCYAATDTEGDQGTSNTFAMRIISLRFFLMLKLS